MTTPISSTSVLPDVANARIDAPIRGWRTFLQGLAFDVVATGVAFMVTVIGGLEWTRTYWLMVGLGLAKSVIVGVISYLARFFIKPANVK